MDKLPPLKPGEKYVSAKDLFKNQYNDLKLPERVLTPKEITELFEPLFQKIENDGVQNPIKLAEQDEKLRKASWAYPGTFIKICKGELSREKLQSILSQRK